MTDTTSGEETFISHLVELRNRMVKASIGIAVVCAALMLWPGPAAVYDFLALPMIEAGALVYLTARVVGWIIAGAFRE